MSVEWLSFSLRAWSPEDDEITDDEFVKRLEFAPGDPATVEDGPGNPLVGLLAVSQDDFDDIDISEDAGARSEAFTSAIHDGLLRAAVWLDRQSPAIFEELRAAGRMTDIFVGGWIEHDQFELDLPPEFLSVCAELGLTISICTND